jgi:gamma-glutamyltranspeptidase/glutathione hydrolase
MAANGGHVTADDLAAYRVLDGRVVSTTYRGYDIHSLAAPAGGGLVVRTLNILENFDLAALTEAQWASVMNQALALAFNGIAEDPAESDLDRLVDKAWAAQQAATIDLQVSPVNDRQGAQDKLDEHHTTHFAIADCEGRVVTITQTVGPLFGSRVITPGLGFVYATTMGSYLTASGQAPGSRPRTTIAPTVVSRDGEVVLALGAAGGTRILSAIVQTISRHIDQGHDPATAVRLPRVHPERDELESGDYVTRGDKVLLEMTPERGWPRDVADYLATAGFEVIPVATHASFGRVHLVAQSGDAWLGVADADWEGTTASAACQSR